MRVSRGDRGSMAVELVVAAPAFIALLLLIGAGGQWVSASGEVGGAARDAARQASLELSFTQAQSAARSVAQADLNNLCPGTAQAAVSLLENGKQVGRGAWANGQGVEVDVEVTVSCTVNLKAFSMIGIPTSQTFSDDAAAPLDPFSQRTS
ncbi:MAG: TadE/TadG family type IV pilus assembly protein [Trebonia sp.]